MKYCFGGHEEVPIRMRGDDINNDNDNDNDDDNDNDVCKQYPLALSGSAHYKILSPGLLFTILGKFIRSYYLS